MPNLIELGYEPESDYCTGCEKLGDPAAFCMQYQECLHSNYKHQPIGNYFNPEIICTRCDECKNSEQAAKQMIPREEVEALVKIGKSEEWEGTGDTYEEGVKFMVERFEKLLKEIE